jgi:uncharacterized protein
MKAFTLMATLLLLIGHVVGEDKLPPKVVRVVGTSEVKVVPDQAVIGMGVENESASASAAKRMVDAASRKILVALRANGVDNKDIQTTFLSLQPRVRYFKKTKTSYFAAEQTMTVTVRDLSKLDTLLESLIKAGGNRIDSVQYQVSDLRKYRDQARDLAVKAAREKAEALAKALGQEIGKANSIEEIPETAYQYQYMANNSIEGYDRTAFKTSGPSTAPGQNSISASVTVSFDLM